MQAFEATKSFLIYILLQFILIVVSAPLVTGVIRKIKAFTQKRVGAPILQGYYDFFKLLRKEEVVSGTASYIFKITPFIYFSSAICAALFIPTIAGVSTSFIQPDVIALVSLLALGRFFMVLSGLDTGSTFGGMGSSREALISSLTEPALFVSLITVSLLAKTTNAFGIVDVVMNNLSMNSAAGLILPAFAVLVVIMTETSRIPIDDPSTHLELTMVHEAMLLEYSGRGLALMEYGSAIRQMVIISILANLFIPVPQLIFTSDINALLWGAGLFLAKILIISIIMAIVEVFTVKLRLFSVPNIAAIAFILSLLGFVQLFVSGGLV